MKRRIILLTVIATIALTANAQLGPEITSWILNTTNATGYNSIPSNVLQLQYSQSNVYITTACVPGYTIGPWPGNPNTASNQNFVFKITRNPQQNTGTPTAIGLGHIGVWVNGVSIFNVSDAQSYNNQGVWNRNAYFWEGPGFDNCLGHPQQQGEYHHHVSPRCLYDTDDSTKHSPLIGYAFDGFPVYGAYAYGSTNGTGVVRRLRSSYQTTTTASRVNGPAVSSTYPAGAFIEDYAYVSGSGDLDARNGRFCVTPEYPNGIYAYFTTLDAAKSPAFPYTFFGSYYGVVQSGNTGPNGGHNTVSESVTSYSPIATGVGESGGSELRIRQNSDRDAMLIAANADYQLLVTDMSGRTVATGSVAAGEEKILDLSACEPGLYVLMIHSPHGTSTYKVPVKIW